eukprot:352836-Chlamydomonas_euryale.AAC.5
MEEVLHWHAWESMHGTKQAPMWLLSGGNIHHGNVQELLHAERCTALFRHIRLAKERVKSEPSCANLLAVASPNRLDVGRYSHLGQHQCTSLIQSIHASSVRRLYRPTWCTAAAALTQRQSCCCAEALHLSKGLWIHVVYMTCGCALQGRHTGTLAILNAMDVERTNPTHGSDGWGVGKGQQGEQGGQRGGGGMAHQTF